MADAVLTEGAATAAPSRGARRPRRSRDLTPLLMLTPAVLVFLCVQVFPMVFSAGLSFFQWDGLSPARFVGLDNFKAFLVDDTILRELFWRSVWNNVRLAIYLTVGVVLIAVPLATAMNAASQRANALFRTTLLLPMVTAGIAVFYAWTALLGAGGPVVTVFDAIGIGFLAPEGGWFSDPKLALIGLAVVMIWSNVPYATLFYLSGLQSIDGSVYEAARIDGANRFQQLRHITWPLLHPITLIVVTLNVVYAMQSYEMVYLMTNGGPTYATNTVGLLSYNLAFGVIGGGSSQYGAAAAITWCLVLGLALGFGSVRVLRALVRRGRR